MGRMLNLLKPNWLKILLFSLIVLLMPAPYLIHECATQISCNVWVWKFRFEPSLFNFVVGGYSESFNVFLGVVEGYFFINDIGLFLLLAYYLIACIALKYLHRLTHSSSGTPNGALNSDVMHKRRNL